MLNAGRSRVRVPIRSLNVFSWPNPSSLIMPLWLTQSNRNEYHEQKEMFLGSIARPVRKADNLTAVCEPIFYKMWEPWHLTTLWATGLLRGQLYFSTWLHNLPNLLYEEATERDAGTSAPSSGSLAIRYVYDFVMPRTSRTKRRLQSQFN
jgi:hypothetical protein